MKEKLLDMLLQAHEQVLAYVDSLDDAERQAGGSPEYWSARDSIGHIVAWARRMADSLQGSEAEFFPDGGDIDEVNAEIYQRYHAMDWETVLRALEETFTGLVEQVRAMSEEDLHTTTRLSWQRGRPLWRLIVGNAYTHPLLHLGYAYVERGDTGTANQLNEAAAQQQLELDLSPAWQGTTLYNLACNYALTGDKAKALAYLAQSLNLAPDLIEWSRQDNDLASLRGDPEYEAIYSGRE